MSINNDIDIEARAQELADKIESDDWEPKGPIWSLTDLAEVRAFELLRREYDAEASTVRQKMTEMRQRGEVVDDALLRAVEKFRDDAATRLADAQQRAKDAGVPADFIESVTNRPTID